MTQIINNTALGLKEGSIVEKAYEINLNKVDEGFLSPPVICYAENLNKAKAKLLSQIRHYGWELKYSGEELSYLNIPVKRRVSSDNVIFEGKQIVRSSIDELVSERKRISDLDEIANNPNIRYCYIIKGIYYRPNASGYTSLKHEAGVYTKEEAVRHAWHCREIRLERIDIDEHNKIINEKISELRGRLL